MLSGFFFVQLVATRIIVSNSKDVFFIFYNFSTSVTRIEYVKYKLQCYITISHYASKIQFLLTRFNKSLSTKIKSGIFNRCFYSFGGKSMQFAGSMNVDFNEYLLVEYVAISCFQMAY